jgi:5-(carboxyamino)imidazole ribonucleotide synthase
VNNSFPTVGLIGGGQNARMFVAPSAALGIDLLVYVSDLSDSAAQICKHEIGSYKDLDSIREFAKKCDVVTFADKLIPLSIVRAIEADGVVVRPSSAALELSQNKEALKLKLINYLGAEDKGKTEKVLIERPLDFNYEITVIVARSPHGQATTWSPTIEAKKDGINVMTITPVPKLSQDLSERAQKLALEIAKISGVVGIAAVKIFVKDEEIFISDLVMGPHNSGLWTIDGAQTSQFEQHLRAVLDLPLGDPTMIAPIAVTGNLVAGKKSNMYRPYLHLMARAPGLHFHQYRNEVIPNESIGHVTLTGENLDQLIDEIEHAIEYMSGKIDE